MGIIVFGPISLVTVHASLILWLLRGGEGCPTGNLVFSDESALPGLVGLAKLRYLDISGNMWGVGFPEFIGEIVSLEVLALNYNNMTGDLPGSAVKNLRNLRQLNMSWNRFDGNLPESLFSLPHLKILDLARNNFGGHIPISSSSGPISLEVLDLSINFFNGTLPVRAFKNIRSLNLAINQFSGSLSVSLFALPHLKFLDLSHNNFEGRFPINMSSKQMPLEVLNLMGNNMSGALPTERAFGNLLNLREFLIALDITQNQFTGNLHWVHYLDNIRLLLLGGNKFEGQITPKLCKLLYLRIIDLSHNRLSGSLPECIANISFIGATDDQIFQLVHEASLESYSYSYSTLYALRSFSFATKGNIYTYGRSFFVSMSGIDLSANMLNGEIPWELGNLSHIKSLNLSYNFFVGPIPTTFGGMEEIESLDLSHNELSGPIPWQLTQLSSLGVFSVAYNNLSGCIPNSGQLGSFGMDSYQDNINLQNITQGKMCALDRDPVPQEDAAETYGDPVLYAITAAAFVLAFWATVGFSFCHPYGRSVVLKLYSVEREKKIFVCIHKILGLIEISFWMCNVNYGYFLVYISTHNVQVLYFKSISVVPDCIIFL
ncbi:hypothetical protein ACQ4PT_061277 [Festuca glaucescens]